MRAEAPAQAWEPGSRVTKAMSSPAAGTLLCTHFAPDSAQITGYCHRPETPARRRDAVLQRYHSKRREPGALLAPIPCFQAASHREKILRALRYHK